MMLGAPQGVLSPRLFQQLEQHLDQQQAGGVHLPEGAQPLQCMDGGWGIPLLLPDGSQLVPLQPSLLGPLMQGPNGAALAASMMAAAPSAAGDRTVDEAATLAAFAQQGLQPVPLFNTTQASAVAAAAAAVAQQCEPPLAVMPLPLGPRAQDAAAHARGNTKPKPAAPHTQQQHAAGRPRQSLTGGSAAQHHEQQQPRRQSRVQLRLSGDPAMFMDDAGGLGGLNQLMRRSSNQLQLQVTVWIASRAFCPVCSHSVLSTRSQPPRPAPPI